MIYPTISDTHGGGVGLINPAVNLYRSTDNEYYHPQLSATQIWLWDLHLRLVQRAEDMLDDMTLIVLGDVTVGMRFIEELVTDKASDQVLIARANLSPWLEMPRLKKIVMMVGTAVHEFGQGSTTELLAALVHATRPDVEVVVTSHLLGYDEAGDPFIDAAHHGPHPGRYLHTAGNIVRNETRNAMLQEILYGMSVGVLRHPPQIYMRGHWHVKRDETIQVGSEVSRMLLFPSYSGITHHARKSGRSPAFLECGGAVVIDRDHVEWVTETKDLRRYERI